uniref:Uncharacterized protein n=1 Tax=Zea mays TaxID=4577 RepID=C4J8D3_MAIZE|nr:unknown [Zea mays]
MYKNTSPCRSPGTG